MHLVGQVVEQRLRLRVGHRAAPDVELLVVLDAVQRWADDELRSANAQIEYILRDALRRAGRLKAPPAPMPEDTTEEPE